MPIDPAHAVPVPLTDRERVVLKEAIRQYLDDPQFATPLPEDEVDAALEQHLQTALDESVIHVQPGMADLYKTVFRSYAQAVQETVGEEDATEEMADFFEGAFKSIIENIEDATGQPQ